MEKFNFIEVTDNEMLKEVFAFRYKILLDIYPEYIKQSELKNELEYDKYDDYSTHFAAIDSSGKVCATVRLIHNSPYGYPTENSMDFNTDNFDKDKLGEISRIFIDPKYRNLKATKMLIDGLKKVLYLKMKELSIEYTYGSLEKSFLRLLKMYKMDYQVIGESQEHGLFGVRYPSVLYTKKLGADNYEV